MYIGTLILYACLFLTLYFEVFLLLSFLERRPGVKNARAPRHYPSVAMIVPCYNEERTVAGTIESLLALEYPAEKLSILVVNDGSSDTTGAIARGYAARDPRIVYIEKENGGKYTALNVGIAHTQADIVGCLDADSFVAPDALLEAVKVFEDPTVMAITPAMKVSKPHSMLEVMQAVEYTFGIFLKKMFDNLAAINVLPGPFSLYRREVFERIGPFRHAYNTEDMEIAFRMHRHGLKIANAHTAIVYTTVPCTIPSLLRQRTRWSRGFLENSRDYYYMYFNPRYGHFGVLVLPVALVAFFAGLYSAGFMLYKAVGYVATRVTDALATGIPPHLPAAHLDWYYLNTGMLTFLIITVLSMTLVAILLGSRIAATRLTLKSFFAYFAFFGLLAPLWLARALFGAVLATQRVWR
ncbi:MAG: glycosyltransferase family 2 protein [Patescibacteria group bacterium]|nr:glycosyltransferase family 2 protein [Patescibacteria group bacterium]